MKIQYLFWLAFLSCLWACSDDKENDPVVPPDPDVPGEVTETLPAGFRDGVNRWTDDSLGFVLLAPGKKQVHLIGDFNNWAISETGRMKKDGDRFWIKIGGLQPGKEYIYQYLIDGKIRIADPYAEKISDPWNDKDIPASVYPGLIAYPTGKTTEIASVVRSGFADYPWRISRLRLKNTEDLVIYELLLRDFTSEGTVRAAREKIPYLKELGINAIELMPFNEFEGNNSWGYNPSFYFAPDKAYGTPDDYKAFIDECHANEIAVIMDIVLNHSFGQSPLVHMYQNADGTPSADNPWYNPTSNFANPDAQWGCDFNHESKYTQQLVDSICSYWMTYYKIDGFRFDFTKGFSNTPYAGADNWGSAYDADRIRNLKRIYDAIHLRRPDALMICEHLADNSEEKELADYGILLWGNMNYSFNQNTMSYLEGLGLGWTSWKQRGWNRPNLVAYMESHDEERIMYKNLAYGNNPGSVVAPDHSNPAYIIQGNLENSLRQTQAAAVILMSFPGPKMIWQFGELGYDYQLNDDRTAPKPVRWDYYDVPARKALYNVFAAMNRLRNTHPAFSSSNYTADTDGFFKQILLRSSGGDACVIANFDVFPLRADVTFSKTGTWKEHFTSADLSVTASRISIELQPGEYRLYLSE